MNRKPKESEENHRLLYLPETAPGLSPFRLLDPEGKEVSEVNEFLDAQATRGLSVETLRTYGYSLLNFWTWISREGKDLRELQEEDVLKYIRFQRSRGAPEGNRAAEATVNLRLTVLCCLYCFHCGHELPAGKRSSSSGRSHPYYSSVASESGYLHPARQRVPKLRVKAPRRLIMPLSPEEVSTFLNGLRTCRDLSIATLMLLCGLRSREVIGLSLGDLSVAEGEMRIRGKGDKERLVPLPGQIIPLIRNYLEVERPKTRTQKLFVSLKGKSRGRAMTPDGLRSIFRHHRRSSGVKHANAHRWRHTFGADMVRGGMSIAVLKKLMGHADIHTTMLYVEISDEDVRKEFLRVLGVIARERLAGSGNGAS